MTGVRVAAHNAPYADCICGLCMCTAVCDVNISK